MPSQKVRDRLADDRRDRGYVIEPGAGSVRGEDAQGHGDEHPQEEAGDRQLGVAGAARGEFQRLCRRMITVRRSRPGGVAQETAYWTRNGSVQAQRPPVTRPPPPGRPPGGSSTISGIARQWRKARRRTRWRRRSGRCRRGVGDVPRMDGPGRRGCPAAGSAPGVPRAVSSSRWRAQRAIVFVRRAVVVDAVSTRPSPRSGRTSGKDEGVLGEKRWTCE